MVTLFVEPKPLQPYSDVFLLTLVFLDEGTVEGQETFVLQQGYDEQDVGTVEQVVQAIMDTTSVGTDKTGHPLIPRVIAQVLGSRFVKEAPHGDHFCVPAIKNLTYISDEGIEYPVTIEK